jgi:Ca2+/Na+ antiporter
MKEFILVCVFRNYNEINDVITLILCMLYFSYFLDV